MQFRLAEPKDIPTVLALWENANAFLKEQALLHTQSAAMGSGSAAHPLAPGGG